MEEMILGCLAICPMGGYEIRSFLKQSTSMFVEISFGTLYPALKRLETKGLITSSNSSTKKNKIIYSITDAGEITLKDWLLNPRSKFKLNYEFLSKLFFSNKLSKQEISTQISIHLDEISREMENLILLKNEKENKIDFYQELTIKFGIDFFEFLKEWNEKLLSDVNEKEV